MQIIDIPIEKIKPFAKNNKGHSARQIDMIANSIKEFGFRNPIIIDKNNEVIAGHGRLLAAKQLGLDKAPCIMVSDLTEKQVRAYRLLDNRIGDFGTYDILNIADELKDIGEMQLGLESMGDLFKDIVIDDVNATDEFTLPEEKGDIVTMTFTLSTEQREIVQQAIDMSKNLGSFDETSNSNSNGNALYRVCEMFINQNNDD